MYGKIFEQIYDSSIAEDWQVRLVFQDMIILADENGVVDRTPEALSRRTNVPLEVVNRAIEQLQKPDPTSRSADENGARIKLLDAHRAWGWEIINFTYYRSLSFAFQKRERTRLRTRKWREDSNKRGKASPSVTVRHRAASASVHVPASVQGRESLRGEGIVNHPPLEKCIEHFSKMGSDYTEAEIKAAFDHFQSVAVNGDWINYQGRTISDWRCALSDTISHRRSQVAAKTYGNSTNQRNTPRGPQPDHSQGF